MGSGSSRSSQVHSIQVEQESGPRKDSRPLPESQKGSQHVNNESSQHKLPPLSKPDSPGSTKLQQKSREREVIAVQQEAETSVKQNYQEKIKSLEKQLTESESQNLDLQERVQVLEERLEYLSSCHQIPEEGENYEETIKAKDQYIAKMEKEHKAIQDETAKLKLRHKKRIKTLTKQLNEAKQETSIQMFELKDEITRLREENGRLQENGKMSASVSGHNETPDLGKMQIVLELSNQISELNDHVAGLERELKEKEDLLSKSHVTRKMEKYDKEEEDMNNLQRLSAGLSSFTKSKERTFESDIKLTASEEEVRGLSGASRDSGISSAGRHKDKRTEGKPPTGSNFNVKNFNQLSDSDDWDSEELPEQFTQSKIHSAPAETSAMRSASKMASRESGASSKTLMDSEDDRWSIDDHASVTSQGSRRLKKKSSFITKVRRENDTSLRTPVPSAAFGDDLDEFNDIPMYPSKQSKKPKKKRSSFFLTEGSSPGGSDVSQTLQVT